MAHSKIGHSLLGLGRIILILTTAQETDVAHLWTPTSFIMTGWWVKFIGFGKTHCYFCLVSLNKLDRLSVPQCYHLQDRVDSRHLGVLQVWWGWQCLIGEYWIKKKLCIVVLLKYSASVSSLPQGLCSWSSPFLTSLCFSDSRTRNE